MSDKALEHFWEYPISWRLMQTLPEDQQAAIAVLSFAVSEVNALSRLYIFNAHKLIGEAAIDCATSIQRFLLLRAWSAKLFEIEDFLNLGGKKKVTRDKELLKLANRALESFVTLRDERIYPIVRDIRNEATSHYSLTAAKKNLKFVSYNANCNMYIHEMSGNSFYPMGEEVMFIGRLNRRGASLPTKDERAAQFESWMNWNVSATNWLSSTHASFVRELIFEKQKSRAARKRTYWIPPKFVGSREDGLAPIFLRKPPK
ncbi:hypothetical protein [Cribrihabitans pelagius]|uniref:hypothetical protein n=1 Tax=Cribrihabitans pelagius TaxID=1765746 RepID=UPI003B59B4DD